MSATASGTLLRIFLDESGGRNRKPVYAAIVEALKDAGFAGATVLKGIEGFGRHKTVHSARTVEFSTTLPVLIEVFEQEEKILAFIPTLRELVDEALITLEHVEVVRWR